MKTMRKTET